MNTKYEETRDNALKLYSEYVEAIQATAPNSVMKSHSQQRWDHEYKLRNIVNERYAAIKLLDGGNPIYKVLHCNANPISLHMGTHIPSYKEIAAARGRLRSDYLRGKFIAWVSEKEEVEAKEEGFEAKLREVNSRLEALEAKEEALEAKEEALEAKEEALDDALDDVWAEFLAEDGWEAHPLINDYFCRGEELRSLTELLREWVKKKENAEDKIPDKCNLDDVWAEFLVSEYTYDGLRAKQDENAKDKLALALNAGADEVYNEWLKFSESAPYNSVDYTPKQKGDWKAINKKVKAWGKFVELHLPKSF